MFLIYKHITVIILKKEEMLIHNYFQNIGASEIEIYFIMLHENSK